MADGTKSIFIYSSDPVVNFTCPSFRSDNEARTFYSYALQRLPGVVRSGKPLPVSIEVLTNNTKDPWRPFNKYEA